MNSRHPELDGRSSVGVFEADIDFSIVPTSSSWPRRVLRVFMSHHRCQDLLSIRLAKSLGDMAAPERIS